MKKRFATIVVLLAVLSIPTVSRAAVRADDGDPFGRLVHRFLRLTSRIVHVLDDYPVIPKP